MQLNEQYAKLADQEQASRTINALSQNGIEAVLVETGAAAKQKVLDLIPEGSEVMTMTSVTLDTLGLASYLNESGKYNPVRKKLNDEKTDPSLKRKLGAGPDYAIGSVHAVTEDGKVLIASNTGSQLPAYVYGAGKVIWVASTKKIVKDLEDGFKRVSEYTLPLESDRAHKAYGGPGSFISKLLIINKEVSPGRITLILVNEDLGF